MHIAKEFNHIRHDDINSERRGGILRRAHGVSRACKLTRYDIGSILLNVVHVI